ncbi:MAG: fluoride efflux transporter CrcB [Dehalococcoidia bacterium]
MTALLVALGAAVGAPLRYLVDRWIQARHDMLFPWGTIVVNAVGSFALGWLLATGPDRAFTAALGTGFCGALTTYSTFAYETARLLEDGDRWHAILNILANVALCLPAAAAGWAIGSAA